VQALQGGGGGGLRLAEFRQLFLRRSPGSWPPPSANWAQLRRLDRRGPAQARLRPRPPGSWRCDHLRCSSVASACADCRRESDLEAIGLAGLALEAVDLGFELGDDVLEPLEVGFGGAQACSSASWRRECSPEMPAASSSSARRACGLAWISSPMRPCPTIDGERAPVDWHRRRASWTSLARASLPLMLVGRSGFALDATRDLELVIGIVEASRRGAVGIVEVEARPRRCCAPGALPEPEKITSSMPEARMFL
jgi:hypothetical protein